ncbi:acetyl-CoA C-acyltransferase [Lentisalinibacter salinarum]|uniref:acetyl-CoA C-acyltransferase n=1 Tax=Lentisalinibacter salinarum TaxID=2992239 RepID=UPI003868C429
MSQDPIVIVAARRTPMGAFQGGLAPLPAPELSAAASRAALADCGLDPAEISEVLLGCVLPAGIGQAPARQAALAAGLPESVGCTTVNKVCGSGMKTVMLGADLIRAGSAAVVMAGGMESMTNAPYLMPGARAGLRMGHKEILDHMFFDGLQNPYDGNMMGHFAEETAKKYGFSREDQDAFAIASVERARAAADSGAFDAEIAPVTVKTRKGETTVDTDEEPGRADVSKIPNLRPAFAKDGTVTAASSSSISDGAATLLLMSAAEAERRGMEPLARIAGHSGYAQEPAWFTTSPVYAIRALQDELGWSPDDVDLYEVNEAFACVTMAAMHDVGIAHEQVNVNGGACALGHPIGASGARIVVTLLHALRNRNAKRGIASLCIGGGEAVALGIETV